MGLKPSCIVGRCDPHPPQRPAARLTAEPKQNQSQPAKKAHHVRNTNLAADRCFNRRKKNEERGATAWEKKKSRDTVTKCRWYTGAGFVQTEKKRIRNQKHKAGAACLSTAVRLQTR